MQYGMSVGIGTSAETVGSTETAAASRTRADRRETVRMGSAPVAEVADAAVADEDAGVDGPDAPFDGVARWRCAGSDRLDVDVAVVAPDELLRVERQHEGPDRRRRRLAQLARVRRDGRAFAHAGREGVGH